MRFPHPFPTKPYNHGGRYMPGEQIAQGQYEWNPRLTGSDSARALRRGRLGRVYMRAGTLVMAFRRRCSTRADWRGQCDGAEFRYNVEPSN